MFNVFLIYFQEALTLFGEAKSHNSVSMCDFYYVQTGGLDPHEVSQNTSDDTRLFLKKRKWRRRRKKL